MFTRCSMLHALEVRSPFMDPALVHFAAGLSTDQLLGSRAHARAFMQSQLDGYESHGEAYETRRLTSLRQAPDGGPPVGVHVMVLFTTRVPKVSSRVTAVAGLPERSLPGPTSSTLMTTVNAPLL